MVQGTDKVKKGFSFEVEGRQGDSASSL